MAGSKDAVRAGARRVRGRLLLGVVSVGLAATAAALTASAELASAVSAPAWLKVVLWIAAGAASVVTALQPLWQANRGAGPPSPQPVSTQPPGAQVVQGSTVGVIQQAGGDLVLGDKIGGDRVGRDKITYAPPPTSGDDQS